jgi:hypothetical protein
MKKTFLIFNVFLWSVLTGFSQNDTIIKNGVVNMATLVLDFETYAFEGGHMAYYVCPTCATDSLQYFVDYMSPGDFGGISFTLNEAQDTFFDGTIVWAGMGQIHYPDNFNLDYPFTYVNESVPEPADIKFLGINGDKMEEDSWLYPLKDSVWQAVDSLSITHLFATEDYKAVVYFYAPSVGVLDPSVAKWIVFLYYADQTQSVTDRPVTPYKLFPNPVTNKLTVSSDHMPSQRMSYELMTLSGKIVKSGHINSNSITIDLSGFPAGIYALKISDHKGWTSVNYTVIKK